MRLTNKLKLVPQWLGRRKKENVVASNIGAHLDGLLDCLYGCCHRRTSFPITLRMTVNGQQSRHADTYIVCVECGRQFAYDWATMRTVKRPAAWAASGVPVPGDRVRAPCLARNGVPLIGTP